MSYIGTTRGGRSMVSIRPAAQLAVVMLALVLASCTSKPAPSSSPSAPRVALRSPSPSPSDPRAAAVQAGVDAYRGMWQAYNDAIEIPDPDTSTLPKYATGKALTTLVGALKSVKDQGLKGTGQLVLAPHVTEITPADAPTSIGIQDCYDDGATHVVRASPGPPYQDTPGGKRLCVATVERQADGTWKVTQFSLGKVGTC